MAILTAKSFIDGSLGGGKLGARVNGDPPLGGAPPPNCVPPVEVGVTGNASRSCCSRSGKGGGPSRGTLVPRSGLTRFICNWGTFGGAGSDHDVGRDFMTGNIVLTTGGTVDCIEEIPPSDGMGRPV